MRSMITPAVAFLWVTIAAVPAMAQIPWNNDLQAAHAQAKQEGKRLLMHFYTDNCVFCERLEVGAFQSPVLAAAIAKNFVPVKIHAEMNPRIAKTFRVTRFPTDVIVTTDGTVLSHGVSPQDPEKFAGLLAQHAPRTPPQDALAQGQASPSTPSAAAPQATIDYPRQSPPTATVSMPNVALAGVSPPTANPYHPSAAADDPRTKASRREEGFRLPANVGGPPANVAAYQPRAADRPQSNPLAGQDTDRSSAELPPANPDAPFQATAGPAADSDQVTIAPELEADLMTQAASTPSDAATVQSISDIDSEKPATDEQVKAKTPPVALQGFCPVALIEKSEWVAGDPAFGSIHLGQLYLFADQASLETFRNDPEPYTPVMNGNDVVLFFEEHRVVEGRRDWGLVDPEFNRVFLFASEETMNHFYVHHQDYVRSAITVTRQAAAEANSKRR